MDINLTPNRIFAEKAAADRIMAAHAEIDKINRLRTGVPRGHFAAWVDKTEKERQIKKRGHAGEGGLQNHSVGDLYPLAVVGYGDGSFQVENLATGERFERFNNSGTAFEAAEARRAVVA